MMQARVANAALERRPLSGLIVVAVEQAVAAPLCTSMLAQAGARVIKIERPEGDFARGYDGVVHGESAYFAWLNAGKESARVDLRQVEDRALLSRFIESADILVQNLAPGAMARHGFGSDELRAAAPRLITVDISGYGEDGDYARMKAYDLLVQGESGLASITGSREQAGRIGVSICDIACGMYAYSGVLEALIARGVTGRGDAIKVSLFDAAANWMTVPLLHHDYGGAAPMREGLRHPSIAPYGVFDTADGQVLISIQNEREWSQFCTLVLYEPDLAAASGFASNVERVANRERIDTHIAKALRTLRRDELIERLQSARIAFGRLNDVPGLSTHPQLRRVAVSSPSGQIDLVAPPVRRGGWEAETGRVPALGEHDQALRREFG